MTIEAEILFDWDEAKNVENKQKHRVGFDLAVGVFLDPMRVILDDLDHRADEPRFYCLGRVHGGILTVRFTSRGNVIRIYGAGYWRKGRKAYEEKNKIYR
jgi:uncharacterized DUF497 family protein